MQNPVSEFDNKLRRAIKDYSDIIRDIILFSRRVLDTISEPETNKSVVFVFTLCLQAANEVYACAIKWDIDVEPPHSYISGLLSKIISASSPVEDLRDEK